MFLEILGVAVILAGVFYGARFAIKRLNVVQLAKVTQYDKEFEEGKVLLPIDKRDFENFEEFKKQTDKVKVIKEKMETMDQDFEDLNFIIDKKESLEEIQNDRQ